jgi:hypothetical protein
MSQPPPKVRACLFDVDGTFDNGFPDLGLLIDSETVSTEGINVFLALHGKGTMPAEVQGKMRGIRLD